jgi:predicted alpha/beta-hydrolase family hydrolase
MNVIHWAVAMKAVRKFADTSSMDAPVRGFLHEPDKPVYEGLVLTHGAGSNCQSPMLIALAEAFCASGWAVLRCDLPFRQARQNGPPPRGSGERDQAGLRAAVETMRRQTHGRIHLGGHSYGGRQASMLAAAQPGLAAALLLLSYPLHPPQRPDVMRTAHLPDLRTPALFVHGTVDGFGSISEMEEAIRLIPACTALLSIPGAGHELIPRRHRDEFAGRIAKAFMEFAQ